MSDQQSDGRSPFESLPTERQMLKLHVKPEKGNGPTEWSLGWEEDPPRGKKVIVDVKKGSGAAEIVFQLVGVGQAVWFDDDDPIWVCEGEECPQVPSTHEQITILDDGTNDRKKLIILDKNTKECTLSYQLNFAGAGPCDPMIRNGGPV
ncbi:MAG: hypothetical protein M3438_04830 [Pseudomonadota bacterium]|nr:hypothetical protein [Sphingomonas sp.]MDQ3478466.1 hypothetical protein [Pseudomonadota bacterium]